MKKNVLALSITAAVAAIGFAGSAQAIGLASTEANPIPKGAAANLLKSADGIGHFLYVPYYSVQSGNNTLINVVNTDTTNGKAVKVRFRTAANSDDVFDFQVFLSPGDVWTGSVAQAADGKAKLGTEDVSCTKPEKAVLTKNSFTTLRSDTKGRTGDALANETREGYVELFNMADIPPFLSTGAVNPLYTAIKHNLNVAPCGTGASKVAWDAIDADAKDIVAAKLKGLYEPTTGLFANWIIVNVNDGGAWSGAATAIRAVDSLGVTTTGALTYFPQTNQPLGVSAQRVLDFSSDPFLFKYPGKASVFDLPDFSIPYTASPSPLAQVSKLSDAIATTKIINEFLNDSALAATTEWILSMPTRRYYVTYDYESDKVLYSSANYSNYTGVEYFNASNTVGNNIRDTLTGTDRQVCIPNLDHRSYNREETTSNTPLEVIVSPVDPKSPGKLKLCGEVTVLSFNQGETASSSGLIVTPSGTLKATVARSALENSYASGWTTIYTPGPTVAGVDSGLPILGYQALRAVANKNTFGATLPHRTDLRIK